MKSMAKHYSFMGANVDTHLETVRLVLGGELPAKISKAFVILTPEQLEHLLSLHLFVCAIK